MEKMAQGRPPASGGTPPDYTKVRLTPGQTAASAAAAAAVCFGIGFLFYHHLLPALLFSVAGLYYPAVYSRRLAERRKAELRSQFKQALYALSAALGAGKSLESAFIESVDDLKLLYPEPQAPIVAEFVRIRNRLMNGSVLEAALLEWNERAQLEDLRLFIETVAACKRTGGNLLEVMRRTAAIISEKMEIEQDIAVQLAQKRFEAKVLAAAPLAVIAALGWASPDYMQPLYGSPAGTAVMTSALVLLLFSYWLIAKIMKIKV